LSIKHSLRASTHPKAVSFGPAAGAALATFAAMALWAAAAPVVIASANSPAYTEYEVKAAFLYKFTKFVEWPEEAFSGPDAPLTIGVLGEDPFGYALEEAVRGKTVSNRRIEVQRTRSATESQRCQMVFISASEEPKLGATLGALKGSSILTIGDVGRFAERGGMIGLLKDGNKIRFQINIDAAEDAGLKISSQLLNLAEVVRNREQGDGPGNQNGEG